jgi:disulfide bond formation protein DsbB
MSFESMRLLFGLLTAGANLAVLAALALLLPGAASLRAEARGILDGREHQLALIVASVATVGSLYLSEIAHLVPCTYCWYQRIAMYPLVVILVVGLLRHDRSVASYVLPIAVIGGSISIYHYATQHIDALAGNACSTGVPCSTAYFEQFGFMSIPYMAGSAFALIVVLMISGRHHTAFDQGVT